MKKILPILLLVIRAEISQAGFISANSSNYTAFLSSLTSGDTLSLAPGTYINNLTLSNLSGTASKPIVIMGSSSLYTTIFQAKSCCNTVSITKCSYLVIKNLQLDGMNLAVDAVKGEGTAGNFAHHITIEYLNIINYGNNQQIVGISTKCSAWDWVIRKNRIIGAGTGMYLGNSPGDKPFVNGLIEYNLIRNTVGYNIEIKHQTDTVRDDFPGTSINGKTIIRYNVFSKESNASTGSNARPCLLVGGFPLNGWGSNDYYEIYGNFFYQNPVEALFQGTGNIMMYENIFVNHSDPAGYRAVYITPQNGVSPQNVKVFHNTVLANNSSGGIRIVSPNGSYQQYCYGNAVFSPSPITNFTNGLDNITDTYANASNYVLGSSTNLATLDLYPKNGQLTGALTPSALFQTCTDWDLDFNADAYNWTYRGAYSGCCNNSGWHLQMDTMPTHQPTATSVLGNSEHASEIVVYPNPSQGRFEVLVPIAIGIGFGVQELEVYDFLGEKLLILTSGNDFSLTPYPDGIYFIRIKTENRVITRKVVKGS